MSATQVLFGQLISRLQMAGSPGEREDILSAAAVQHVFTCQQLGIILMNMRYSAERETATQLLAGQVVDPENASSHLLPYVACEPKGARERIIEVVLSRGRTHN